MNGNQKIVIALGGNAILQKGEKGTFEDQFNNITKTAKQMIEFVKKDYTLVITHGNGPQIGNIYIQNNLASDLIPAMPLDVCGAMSQGMLGYLFQQAIKNELANNNIRKSVATVITQIEVNKKDRAFKNPTKPIGPFHTEKEAKFLIKKTGFVMKEEKKKGWRRVVPSPKPNKIVEIDLISKLSEAGYITIVSGGGGIPVIKSKDKIYGIEAVIDKDLAAAKLATDIKADVLLILTDVEKVLLNYNTDREKPINRITIKEAKKFLKEGHFKEGSMKPKMEAAIEFVENGGEKTIITSLNSANKVANNIYTGTEVVR